MLDPASAIGLAANIFQMIDYTVKIVSRSHEFYISADGALVRNSDLEVVVMHLERHILRLNDDTFHIRSLGDDAPGAEGQMRPLILGVNAVLHRVKNTLESLKVQPQNRSWDSIRQAIRSIWKEGELEELEAQLDRLRKRSIQHSFSH